MKISQQRKVTKYSLADICNGWKQKLVLCQIGGVGYPSDFIVILYVVTNQNCEDSVLL